MSNKTNPSTLYLPVGIYYSTKANMISGLPTALGCTAVLILRAHYNNNEIATVVIDIEGTGGIYTRRFDGESWKKQ